MALAAANSPGSAPANSACFAPAKDYSGDQARTAETCTFFLTVASTFSFYR